MNEFQEDDSIQNLPKFVNEIDKICEKYDLSFVPNSNLQLIEGYNERYNKAFFCGTLLTARN